MDSFLVVLPGEPIVLTQTVKGVTLLSMVINMSTVAYVLLYLTSGGDTFSVLLLKSMPVWL